MQNNYTLKTRAVKTLDTWNRWLYIAAVDSQLFAEIEMYQVSDLQPG